MATATHDVTAIRLVIDGGGTSTDVGLFHGESLIKRTQLASYKPTPGSSHTDLLCRDLGSWMASASLLPPHDTTTFVLVGMAGVWTAHEKQSYLNALTDSWITYVSADVPRMAVLSDVELVHLAAFGSASGSVLIAGTGSIAVHRTADGDLQRVGGWGPRVDDAGGGFWMGREALTAVARMVDGRGPHTLLIRPVAAYLRTNPEDVEQVALRLRTASVDGASRLARAVLTYADEGDDVALSIRSQAVRELASLVAVLPESSPVALYGSLFANSAFAAAVMAAVRQPAVTILEDVLSGAIAALPAP